MARHALAFILVILSGCTTLPRPAHVSVALTETHAIELPSPASLGRNIRLNQLASWQHDTQIERMQFVVEVDNNSLRMVGFTPWGSQMFSASLGPEGLAYERPDGMAARLRPEYMLADFILTYWPAEQLTGVLGKAGLDLVEIFAPLHQRNILADGKPIIQIGYVDANPWVGKVTFTNLYRNYSFQIETLVYEPL